MYHSPTGQMHRFYMVHVFAEQLRRWIMSHKPKVLVVERPSNRREKGKGISALANSAEEEAPSTRTTSSSSSSGAYLSFANFRFDRDAINRCLLLRN